MMRFLLVTVLTAIATWFALLAMPWWVAMPIAFFLILIFPMKNGKSFLATGLGAALPFLLISYMADSANEHILSAKMAMLFQLPSYIFMSVLTTLIGFITAGLGGWTAASLYKMLRHKPSEKEVSVSQTSQL